MKVRIVLVAAGLLGVVAGVLGAQMASHAPPVRPASAASVPVCMPPQLRLLNDVRFTEKTQQNTMTVTLVNTSRQRCELTGYPAVTLEDAHGKALEFTYRDQGDQMLTNARPRQVILAPGGRAWFGINKNSCDAKPTRAASTLTLWQLTIPVSASLGYCPSSDLGQTVDISPFEPTALAVLAR